MNIDLSSIDLKNLIQSKAGVKFKGNKCCCPFHHEKTPSFSVSDNNHFYKCFGCGEGGDALTFIQKHMGISFIEAVKYLGLDGQLTDSYKTRLFNREKVEHKFKAVYGGDKKMALKDIYEFTNSNGEVLYYKGKLKDEDNVSQARYASISNGEVDLSLRDINQVPYKLDAIQKALAFNNPIFVTEGEKDADTLTNVYGKCATSLKGVKLSEYNFFPWKGATVYFVGDTGKAGEKYREDVYAVLRDIVEKFYIVELEGIEQLGDNKDVTDWTESLGDIEQAVFLFNKACDPLNVWDWSISRKWRHCIMSSKKVYVPNPKSIDNVIHFLASEGMRVEYSEVSGNMVSSGSNKYVIKGDGTCQFDEGRIIGDMWQHGCKIDKDTVCYALAGLKKRYKRNLFQEMILANSNNNYHLIDQFIDLLNLATDFERSLVRKFLFGYVRQGFNSEANRYVADGVLVIRGEQGIGKSKLVSELGLNSNDYFHIIKTLDLDDTQSMRKATKCNLAELQEMVIYGKKDVEKLKAFLTTPNDEYRPLYSNRIEHTPRFTAFICTTNDDEFLSDPTGSRRFWVIEPQVNYDARYGKDAMGKILVPSNVGLDVAKLLGAVYHYWMNTPEHERNALCRLDNDEAQQNTTHNAVRYNSGNVGKIIGDIFNLNSTPEHFMCKSDFYKLLGIHGINKLAHGATVEKFLKNYGVKVRGSDGQTPRSKCGKHRGYMLWKLTKEYTIDGAESDDE